jgi:hypothetical protein
MMKLVSSVSQVMDNLRRYNDNVQAVADLMPYARSWYALRTKSGWLFGPSKYIGYDGMTPQKYLGSEYSTQRHGRISSDDANIVLDGRITEGVLRRWSDLVEEGHPEYARLHTALNELCARHGKKPNSLARISIIKSEPDLEAPTFNDDLVTLLAAVFRGLTPAQKSAFRKQIL